MYYEETSHLKLLAFLLCSSTSQATLIDNLDGTVTRVRSDGSALMWLQDANYAKTSGFDSDGKMTWHNAKTWVSSLTFAGHSDWRLPWAFPVDGRDAYQFPTAEVDGITKRYNMHDLNQRYDGSTDRGYNIDSLYSEMGYMLYEELGNLGLYEKVSGSPSSPPIQTGWGLNNMGLFVNLDKDTLSNTRWNNRYWSDIVYDDGHGSGLAWTFSFGKVQQMDHTIDINNLYAWAVRDSDLSEIIPVPEPTTIALFGIGLAGFAGGAVRRRFKRGRRY